MADQDRRGLPVLLTLASLVVLIAGLRAAAPLIVPFLLALFLAILSLPLLGWLQRRRWPTGLAVAVTVLVNLAAIAAILTLVAGSFRDFTEAAPRYQARLAQMADATVTWLRQRGLDTAWWLPDDLVNPGAVLELVGTLLRGVAAVLSNAFLVFLTVIFILFEAAGFRAKLAAALGGGKGYQASFDRATLEVQRYLGIKTVLSLVTGALVAGSLALVGVDFPILWGLVAFIFNFIPNLGSVLAAVPAVLLALVQLGVGHALVVGAIYLVINMLLGNIIEPALMGRRLGLSTLVVFVSLVFWGWVWGPVGMLLSVPLTMVLKITFEQTAGYRWIAVLLEPGSPAPAPGPGER